MDDDVKQELRALRTELRRTNESTLFRLNDSLLRIIGVQLLRGLAFGFGSVLGATIVVSLAAYTLSTMEIVPIIGDWAKAIAEEMRADGK